MEAALGAIQSVAELSGFIGLNYESVRELHFEAKRRTVCEIALEAITRFTFEVASLTRPCFSLTYCSSERLTRTPLLQARTLFSKSSMSSGLQRTKNERRPSNVAKWK